MRPAGTVPTGPAGPAAGGAPCPTGPAGPAAGQARAVPAVSLAVQHVREPADQETRRTEAAMVVFHVGISGERGREAEAGGVAGVDAGQERLHHPGVGLAAGGSWVKNWATGLLLVLAGAGRLPPWDGQVGHEPGGPRPATADRSGAATRPGPGTRG